MQKQIVAKNKSQCS